MRRFAAGALLGVAMMGCGKSSPPCKGAACPNVAGTYSLTLTQLPTSNCTEISYDGTGGEAVITQDGSALTLTIPGSPLNTSEPGTLDVNNTATFSAGGTVNLFGESGELPYNDENSVTLTFTAQPEGVFNIGGNISDTLTAMTATTPNGPDANCFLTASLTGSD